MNNFDNKKIFLNYYNHILENANTAEIEALKKEAQNAINKKDEVAYKAAIAKLRAVSGVRSVPPSRPPVEGGVRPGGSFGPVPPSTASALPAAANPGVKTAEQAVAANKLPAQGSQTQDATGSFGYKGVQDTVNPNPSGISPERQKWIDDAPWYEKPFRQMGNAIYGDPEYDKQLQQANAEQGKANIQQFSPLNQNQRLNDVQNDQTFKEFQAQNSPAGPYPGAPTPPEPGKAPGPIAQPEYGRSVGQKFVQATTGNAPTNTGAPNQAEIEQMKKLHGSFNPNAPGDLKKLDDLRQAQQQLGSNADPKALANKAYALQYSRDPKKSASAARPGQVQPGVVKTPPGQQQQATPQQPRPTVPNSTLGGIPGSISNAIGRVGNTAENLMKGQLGQGAQSRPTAQPAQQPNTQQSQQQRRKPPVYSKAGGR